MPAVKCATTSTAVCSQASLDNAILNQREWCPQNFCKTSTSQATSVKAEPGSNMGSIAPALQN